MGESGGRGWVFMRAVGLRMRAVGLQRRVEHALQWTTHRDAPTTYVSKM